MARRPETFKLRWRMPGGQVVARPNGKAIAQVRFRHDGHRYAISTGERDPIAADAAAKREYAKVIQGQGQRRVAVNVVAASDLAVDVASWLEALEATHDPATVQQYTWVAAKWAWPNVTAITDAAIATHVNDRLRVTTRETARKHMVVLRTFLSWAKLHKRIATMPEFPKLEKHTPGKRARKAAVRVQLTLTQVSKLLRALPESSRVDTRKASGKSRNGADLYRVRDYFIVLWETGLRPATLHKLSAPEHYTKGAKSLTITPDIDKSRNRVRNKNGGDASVPLSRAARTALDRSVGSGLIFGVHERDKYILATARAVLGRDVHPYDLKHSRVTSWFSARADPLGVSYATGVKLDTLIEHYTHPGEDAARRIVGGKR